MARAVRFSVGSRRITSNVPSAQAGATRDLRVQMASIEKKVKQAIQNIDNLIPEAIHYGLQPIYDKSQIYVPVLTGDLKISGFITTSKTSRGATGAIGYGAAGDPFYAIWVHERLDLKHESPTQAKFLEAAVHEKLHRVRTRILEFMKMRLNV